MFNALIWEGPVADEPLGLVKCYIRKCDNAMLEIMQWLLKMSKVIMLQEQVTWP